MDVAILGGGISGLACAITLERLGVTPSIFEKRSCPGDRFVNAESLLSVLNRPVGDCLPYLAEKYHITLKPISEINKLVFHSKNKSGAISGNIGYTNVRGRREDSFEYQLAKQVKNKINFNADKDYKDIKNSFEAVVMATGDGEYAKRLGNYRCDLTFSLKGVTVEGKFMTDTPHVWFNYEILPKGYGWAIPFSDSEANLVIAYPDYPENMALDIDEMWNKFYELAKRDLEQDFRVTDQFQVRKYMIGVCEHPKIDNTYFVGNNFGALSPGLGFGQFASMLTGIYAAYDICGEGNYEELVKPLFENYNHSLTVRRFLERLEDDNFDMIVGSLNIKMLESLNSHFFSSESEFDLLKWITPFL